MASNTDADLKEANNIHELIEEEAGHGEKSLVAPSADLVVAGRQAHVLEVRNFRYNSCDHTATCTVF
jgi:hypothetical protein